jgi:CDP-4-dehydro-6-deoxyglucose reductase, E1
MENSPKQDIQNFVAEMGRKYGVLPKFAHNLVSKSPEKVYYSGPYFDEAELTAAIETLLFGKWSSSGEVCMRFEQAFSKATNSLASFFCNSGSSANLLLIAACKEYFGWKDGDGIIVSSVGFPTTVSAIVQNGLKPIFIDIEWNTLNFDLSEVARKTSDSDKTPVAVFLSPVLGNPPDMDYLTKFCEIEGIKLLLDNCDSLGSKWKGRYLNEYAVASSCSFYPAHEITTLEGGMVSSNVFEIVRLARSFATWGRDCYCIGAANLLPNGVCGKRFSNWIADKPDVILDHKYSFSRMGWNLKPLDLQAAIGLEQLKKLDYICGIRKDFQLLIQRLFANHVAGVKFPTVYKETDWVPFGVPIICDTREQKLRLVQYLENNGIQTRNYFAGNLLMHKGYRHLDDYTKYPEANKVLDLVFFVGCAPTISEENLKYIERILKKWTP